MGWPGSYPILLIAPGVLASPGVTAHLGVRGPSPAIALMARSGILMSRGFAVFLTSAVLVLSACSDGKSGVPSPSSSTSSVSTPAQAVSGSAERVRVGSETEVFDSPLPSSPAEAKVIRDFRKAQVLWDKSETAQHLVAPVTDYVTSEALAHLRDAVAAARQQDLVPAGADRMFKTRVTILSARSATVATCDDGSKFREKNRRTGRVDAQLVAAPDQQYMFVTWRMVRLSGRWASTGFSLASLPAPAAQHCQP